MDKPKQDAHVDWKADPYWRQRRISPAQLLVHDIRLEGWRQDAGPMLEIREVLSSSLLPDLVDRDRLRREVDVSEWMQNRSEQYHFKSLVSEYGWLNGLRSKGVQESVDDPEGWRKCRWIHISSKFSEYLEGCLLGLSDWSTNPARVISAFRKMELCIYQNERFSKHGRYFSPFVQRLAPDFDPDDDDEDRNCPMLINVPFLDWTVEGETPALRFQVDPREGFQSSKGSSHILRSLLQHFYRLEDTSDREHNQVFTKHRPWINDRDLDLKVRSLYGHYPCGLNVDELWILVIDARHIVTFSSNQSWKSRWPPLQFASRIAEISFRGIRNSFFRSEQNPDFTATTHAVACLSGAVGMLHRSFWADLKLCLVDRYAGYLGHLQYRLHRSPSTRLVMDLLQAQEELNIIIQITEQQLDLISQLQDILETNEPLVSDRMSAKSQPRLRGIPERRHMAEDGGTLPPFFRATYRQLSSSSLEDPVSQLLENLQREYADLCDLRDNSNNLVNRTIQLVNIRLEDHGKAILVFTIVTVIFLPLSFITSFFGMNFSDIRNMDQTQRLFWIVAASVTVGVVGLASFLAFYGGDIVEAFMDWSESRSARRRSKPPKVHRRSRPTGVTSFEVLDVSGPGAHYS